MSEVFEKGKWRRATVAEKKKYKKQYDALRAEIKDWYFGKSIEFVEENNSEGKDRLMLMHRDENGHYGVNNSCDIKL